VLQAISAHRENQGENTHSDSVGEPAMRMLAHGSLAAPLSLWDVRALTSAGKPNDDKEAVVLHRVVRQQYEHAEAGQGIGKEAANALLQTGSPVKALSNAHTHTHTLAPVPTSHASSPKKGESFLGLTAPAKRPAAHTSRNTPTPPPSHRPSPYHRCHTHKKSVAYT